MDTTISKAIVQCNEFEDLISIELDPNGYLNIGLDIKERLLVFSSKQSLPIKYRIVLLDLNNIDDLDPSKCVNRFIELFVNQIGEALLINDYKNLESSCKYISIFNSPKILIDDFIENDYLHEKIDSFISWNNNTLCTSTPIKFFAYVNSKLSDSNPLIVFNLTSNMYSNCSNKNVIELMKSQTIICSFEYPVEDSHKVLNFMKDSLGEFYDAIQNDLLVLDNNKS